MKSMRKSVLAIFFLFTSLFSFAQEFTAPDSAAILKAKVKSVKIYYTGTGSKHYLTHEYRYDQKGHCIYSREGTTGYYYSYAYNEKSQMISSFQRAMSGALIFGYFKDYYPNGKMFHVKVINERDSIHPEIIYTYDTLGNTIEENHFRNGKLIRNYKNEYDSNNKIIHRTDSSPGKCVFESRNSKTIRQTYLTENNELIESCLIYYDEKGRLSKTVCTTGNKPKTYSVIYENETDFHVLIDEKPISKPEYVEWDRKFNWLMPRMKEEDFGLPYADPVPLTDYKHELVRDKKGNITKDIVTGAYPYMDSKPVEFDYEYEYW